ncbi:hypothetical protein [Chitinophaga nivalis]|uniref:Uncharacterized protein n=1 Tax=Chitinophaga nivalis TaxID=2991709 RepID=A0ABT3IIN1_9BACT|nr:hypothetical protein [Chitinophaga nivalis]MCW3466469.1 hypothetical protein [Chitinophaga nivalis]MCW3483840.1 hypothetical protein [Chitinophaga nivalis]
MIAIIVLLCFFLFAGWVLLLRHRKALQIAHIHLLQHELKAAGLLYQLREVTAKYRLLEAQLQEIQNEPSDGEARD